jgi:hypothetical protein
MQIPADHLMLSVMEQKMMNEMSQIASQWMNLYRTISYQQSHGMDEMKRMWLRKMLFDCLTLEEYKTMFGLQPSDKTWGISVSKSYVCQIEETCECLCRSIQMIGDRVRMLNVQMKTQWMGLMREFMNDLRTKNWLKEEESDCSECEDCCDE